MCSKIMGVSWRRMSMILDAQACGTVGPRGVDVNKGAEFARAKAHRELRDDLRIELILGVLAGPVQRCSGARRSADRMTPGAAEGMMPGTALHKRRPSSRLLSPFSAASGREFRQSAGVSFA